MSRRFVAFVCTGRQTHKERRIRRFRWEPIVDTIAAGPGPLIGAGDIEAWEADVAMWREQMEAGITDHLIEDATVRVVDGVPMSRHGDPAAFARDTMDESRYGNRALRCRTCGRDVPLTDNRLAAIVRGCMDSETWRFDISGLS